MGTITVHPAIDARIFPAAIIRSTSSRLMFNRGRDLTRAQHKNRLIPGLNWLGLRHRHELLDLWTVRPYRIPEGELNHALCLLDFAPLAGGPAPHQW